MTKRVTKPIKYTAEFVSSELSAMIEEIKANPEIIYIGQLFDNRVYSRQRFSEWLDKFKDNGGISDAIKKIEDMLETRAAVGGMTGKLNPTVTIFHLKNNYKWVDRSEIDTKHTGEVTFINDLPRPK